MNSAREPRLSTLANISLRNITAFVTVARFGSFTKAAGHLLLSQPALTTSIRQLEEAVGVRLFDRTTRRVSLTAEGQDFLPKAEALVRDADAAIAGIRDLAERRRGSVGIASVSSFANHVLARALPEFVAAYPGINVRLRMADSEGVCRLVARNEVDFGFSGLLDGWSELAFALLLEDPVGLVCHRDHPLAKGRPAFWRDLNDGVVIGVGNSRMMQLALDAVPELAPGLAPARYEIENPATLIGLLRAGLGVTVLPAMTFPAQEPDLVFRPLTEPPVNRQVYFVSRADRSLSAAAESMADVIERHMEADARSEVGSVRVFSRNRQRSPR